MNDNKKQTTGLNGIFYPLLTVVLLVLRCCHVIDMPWWCVFLPLMITGALLIVSCLVATVVATILALLEKCQNPQIRL